jgi:integrase
MKNTTINDLFELYLTFTKNVNSVHTTQSNISMYNKHIKPKFGKCTIQTITSVDYQNLINKLLSDEKSPKTLKNIKSLLHTMYNIGIKNSWIKDNPLLIVTIPKFDNTVLFHYSINIQKKFIKSIINYDELPYCDIFFFLLQGRRLNEVLSITWDMINFEDSIYHIPPKINKAKKLMSYSMTDGLKHRLINIHSSSKTIGTYKPDGYIFVNPKTNNKYVDISRAWKRFLSKNNLPKIRLHDIRHLIATYSINYLQIPIEHISHTLGHSDITVTQKYITKVPQTAKNVIDKIIDSVEIVK